MIKIKELGYMVTVYVIATMKQMKQMKGSIKKMRIHQMSMTIHMSKIP